MRIIYVAKHAGYGNDDEGSITDALVKLGHDVVKVNEECVGAARAAHKEDGDICLFHHWTDFKGVRRMRCPSIFWYFDLVDYHADPSVDSRSKARISWMENMIPYVKMGCCTDGDWVNRDETGKLVRLLQGADQRIPRSTTPHKAATPIIFTGQPHGGDKRRSCIDELQKKFKHKFSVVRGVHGRDLADTLISCQISIAPDHPVTDNYWSNRVYLTLGMGGFLLHPYAKTLRDHYGEEELIMYTDRADLIDKIHYFQQHPEERATIAEAGYQRTWAQHTYLHRCERLIELVKERVL